MNESKSRVPIALCCGFLVAASVVADVHLALSPSGISIPASRSGVERYFATADLALYVYDEADVPEIRVEVYKDGNTNATLDAEDSLISTLRVPRRTGALVRYSITDLMVSAYAKASLYQRNKHGWTDHYFFRVRGRSKTEIGRFRVEIVRVAPSERFSIAPPSPPRKPPPSPTELGQSFLEHAVLDRASIHDLLSGTPRSATLLDTPRYYQTLRDRNPYNAPVYARNDLFDGLRTALIADLIHSGDTSFLAVLRRLVQREAGNETRKAAVRAVGILGEASDALLLENIVRLESSADLRRTAIDALASLGAQKTALLRSIAEQEQDEETRLHIVRNLLTTDPDGAFAFFHELSRNREALGVNGRFLGSLAEEIARRETVDPRSAPYLVLGLPYTHHWRAKKSIRTALDRLAGASP